MFKLRALRGGWQSWCHSSLCSRESPETDLEGRLPRYAVFFAVLCCAVLFCGVLHCVMLCCAVLWCGVLCCAVPCPALLSCTSCAVLCCAELSCALLCSALLCCSALLRAVPCCAMSMQQTWPRISQPYSYIDIMLAWPQPSAPETSATALL